jgi:cyclopropane fatty-acyl-phospholipid synthase-like methyltransferase
MSDFGGHTRDFWNERYSAEAFAYGEAPNEYLVSQQDRFHPGMRALVPGDGEGRNGVWLAEQGLDVVTVDLSDVGHEKANRLAARRNVSITTVHADLTTWTWPVAEFDVVVSIFLHLPSSIRPRLHRAMLYALRPGGLLVIEAFRPEQLAYKEKYGSSGGPPVEDMLFTAEMLREDFSGADVVELATVDVDMGENGPHSGLTAVVRGVFRRPDERAAHSKSKAGGIA